MKPREPTWVALAWIAIAASAFHLAYGFPKAAFVIVVYLFALVQLAQTESWRRAFYSGLAVGLLIAGVRLDFFWNVFGTGAPALWLVFAFWIGLFVVLARLALLRLGMLYGCTVLPIIWCGLEYFRSELYFLRFSWLSPGLAFGTVISNVPIFWLGTYGIGFLLMAIASAAVVWWTKGRVKSLTVLALGCVGVSVCARLVGSARTLPEAVIRVAGVQMEFPNEQEVLLRLNEVIRIHPEANLLVLSEYTFMEPIPERVKRWCHEKGRYLVVGGKDPAGTNNFYDTGFVISPGGEVIFRQGKSVPIQFFKDGLPASQQRLWDSPWGRIGICICYDLSYSRVTDRLIEQGAQALIVPTMDVVDWGIRQHELHARVAPLRAAEYGVPIFRVASSGISQLVDCSGHRIAQAPCPGDGAMIAGVLELRGAGTRPLDRWGAPVAALLTTLLSLLLGLWRGPRPKKGPGAELVPTAADSLPAPLE